jgi:hypothetical protein
MVGQGLLIRQLTDFTREGVPSLLSQNEERTE